METINVNTEKQASDLEVMALEGFESIINGAKENFMRDGELAPVVFISLKVNENKMGLVIILVSEFLRCENDKEKLSKLMHETCKDLEPVAISMITEGWMSCMDKGLSKEEVLQRYQYMPPSKDPDRIEMIHCSFESENIQKMVVFKIIREPELKLEEYPIPEGTSYEGRFSNILKDMKKVRNN